MNDPNKHKGNEQESEQKSSAETTYEQSWEAGKDAGDAVLIRMNGGDPDEDM